MTGKILALVTIENIRDPLVVLVWGIAISSAYAQALYQRGYLTLFDYALVVAICMISGAVINDFARALIGYFAAAAIALAILFITTTLPALTGAVASSTSDVVFTVWTIILFTSVFPFPFIGFLIASIVGSALGERFLS